MTLNHEMALRVVWGTRLDDDTPAPDARELLEMCGLVEPGAHVIAPDITGGIRVPTAGGPTGGNTDEPPLRRDPEELPPKNVTTPPGLRVLPPLAPATSPAQSPPAAPVKAPTAPKERKARGRRPKPAPNPEEARLLAAGVNPDAAAVLAAGPTRPEVAPPKPTALPAKRLAPVLPPIAHGTVEGWQQHHDRGALPPCDACRSAVAPPPAPVPVKPDDWLAAAQRSPHRAVARAAAIAIGIRVRIEVATTAQLADGRLLARLDTALDDVARAQARASSRTNGATA